MIKKASKRIVTLLLIVSLVLSLVPTLAFAHGLWSVSIVHRPWFSWVRTSSANWSHVEYYMYVHNYAWRWYGYWKYLGSDATTHYWVPHVWADMYFNYPYQRWWYTFGWHRYYDHGGWTWQSSNQMRYL